MSSAAGLAAAGALAAARGPWTWARRPGAGRRARAGRQLKICFQLTLDKTNTEYIFCGHLSRVAESSKQH